MLFTRSACLWLLGALSAFALPSPAVKRQATNDTGLTPVTTPLPKWDYKKQKMYGVSMGNWLLLERWMHEDWFVQQCGADCWDEWDFSQNLGANAATALTEHWNGFISRENVTALKQAGMNHIRVPIGFWALIPQSGSEPYVFGGQLDQVTKLASWCYEEQMYILLDLHGMPGSQNGLQQSGHNTSDIQFWSQQDRADATVKAALDYITASPYRSVFSALQVINEPVTYTDGQISTLRQFYERSYTQAAAVADPIPIILHDAYKGLEFWRSYFSGKNVDLVWMSDHPYPGNTYLDSGAGQTPDAIINQVCSRARSYTGFPAPVIVTEFALVNPNTDDAFLGRFYETQLAAFSNAGGAFFWSFDVRTASQSRVLALPAEQQVLYSWSAMSAKGDVVPRPADTAQSTSAFIDSLSSSCGDIGTPGWAS